MVLQTLVLLGCGTVPNEPGDAADAPFGEAPTPGALGAVGPTPGTLDAPPDPGVLDTAAVGDTGAPEDTGAPAPAPLAAHATADVVAGAFPLDVTFDASASELGSGHVSYAWDFGDGATGSGASPAHAYVGRGSFVATLTLVDDDTGATSTDALTVDVSTPACPSTDAPVTWGTVADGSLDELSGIVASGLDPDAYWVHEDSGNAPVLTAIDRTGATLASHPVSGSFPDWEDIAAATDPETGVPMLFLGDIGDNGYSRSEVAVWVLPEPDPHADGPVSPLRMRLTYPNGPRNAETLLVDPVTMDLYVVTKESSGVPSVYVKRAPHDAEGPFVLEPAGTVSSLAFTATGGDVSPDGSRIVVRDYTATAHLWFRDGYLPLEDAFAAPPCAIPIAGEQQGEAIGFTADGGIVTTSEGGHPPVHGIGLRP